MFIWKAELHRIGWQRRDSQVSYWKRKRKERERKRERESIYQFTPKKPSRARAWAGQSQRPRLACRSFTGAARAPVCAHALSLEAWQREARPQLGQPERKLVFPGVRRQQHKLWFIPLHQNINLYRFPLFLQTNQLPWTGTEQKKMHLWLA